MSWGEEGTEGQNRKRTKNRTEVLMMMMTPTLLSPSVPSHPSQSSFPWPSVSPAISFPVALIHPLSP